MSSVHAAAAGDTCNTHKSEAQMEIEKTNKKVNKKQEILNTPRAIAQLRKQCVSSGAGRVLSFVGRSDYRLGNMKKTYRKKSASDRIRNTLCVLLIYLRYMRC